VQGTVLDINQGFTHEVDKVALGKSRNSVVDNLNVLLESSVEMIHERVVSDVSLETAWGYTREHLWDVMGCRACLSDD